MLCVEFQIVYEATRVVTRLIGRVQVLKMVQVGVAANSKNSTIAP